MKVSIIVPCFNYENYIELTIDSIFKQTYTNIECIVVNDGSTDQSLAIINDLKNSKYPQLIIVNKENGGLSSARNAGLKIATGDFLAFLDADDIWLPGKISNQLKVMETKSADLVFSDYLFFNEKGKFEHFEPTIPVTLNIEDFIKGNPCRASSSSILMKRKVFEQVGFFDLNLRSLEDLDYWTRSKLAGFRFEYCNKKDILLRKHTLSMQTNFLKMYFFHIILLEKQFSLLNQQNIILDRKTLLIAVRSRLSKVAWYASELKRRDLLYSSILIGIHYCGLGFLSLYHIKGFIRTLLVRK